MPLFKLFLDIALFKKGPQHVPASGMLLALTLATYLAVGLILLGLETSWIDALLQVGMEVVLLLGFTWATLAGVKLTARFLQTGSAMLGTDALISAFAIPVLAWMTGGNDSGIPGYLLLMLLMLWHLAVIAHILRHALSCALTVAIVMAIVYIGGSYQIMVMLFAPSA